MSPISLVVASDPLCGWCFGLTPALRKLQRKKPKIGIEVLPGGMWTGTPARAYSDFAAMIKGAEGRLQDVTGRKPSPAFHRLISKDIDASSERPGLAILLMQEKAPKMVLEFSHGLQEAHFIDGQDLNAAQTYDGVCDQIGAPRLDTDEILAATLDHPKLQAAYGKCAGLGPSGFPTVFVQDATGSVIGKIPSTYDPERFVAQVQAYL